jgi:hypothetical protein
MELITPEGQAMPNDEIGAEQLAPRPTMVAKLLIAILSALLAWFVGSFFSGRDDLIRLEQVVQNFVDGGPRFSRDDWETLGKDRLDQHAREIAELRTDHNTLQILVREHQAEAAIKHVEFYRRLEHLEKSKHE